MTFEEKARAALNKWQLLSNTATLVDMNQLLQVTDYGESYYVYSFSKDELVLVSTTASYTGAKKPYEDAVVRYNDISGEWAFERDKDEFELLLDQILAASPIHFEWEESKSRYSESAYTIIF